MTCHSLGQFYQSLKMIFSLIVQRLVTDTCIARIMNILTYLLTYLFTYLYALLRTGNE